MNLQGLLHSIDPRQGQTSLVARLIKTDALHPTSKRAELCKRGAEVIINAGLVATGTASALLEAGKFTVSAPAWAVGQPILWVISGQAQKIWGMPKALEYGTTYLPTRASLCETGKRVVNQALGALSSLITTLRQVAGWANPTPANIRYQITHETVDLANETIADAAKNIRKQIKAEKKAEKQKKTEENKAKEKEKVEDDAKAADEGEIQPEKETTEDNAGNKPGTVEMNRDGKNKGDSPAQDGKCIVS